MEDEKIIVLVSDRDDSRHGEISVLDDPQKAERLVETLLEAGFEQERIRVFSGKLSEFQISHRPVVALMPEGEGGERQPAMEGASHRREANEPPADEPPAAEPAAEESVAAEHSATEQATAAAEAAQGEPLEQPLAEATEEEEAAEAAAPVKFSSLFRSA